MWEEALVHWNFGPNVLICGANNSGKSSACKLLINYALKHGSTPIFIDLDIDNNELVPPGCIGASMIKEPLISNPLPMNDITDETLCFFVGKTSSNYNFDLYNR